MNLYKKCPNCAHKINKESLICIPSSYKPKWYEIYYERYEKYLCKNCGVELIITGQIKFLITLFVLLATAILIYENFDVQKVILGLAFLGLIVFCSAYFIEVDLANKKEDS